MIRLIWNIISGQIRARKIARHYGVHHQLVIDLYAEWAEIFIQRTGYPFTLVIFEDQLRRHLTENGKSIDKILPIYMNASEKET